MLKVHLTNAQRRMEKSAPLVCGVATAMVHKFGWSCFWTRVGWIGALVFISKISLLGYLVLAIFLEQWKKPV
ncbi:MAG: PspC domain-containing protein [Shewanella sp.]